MSNVYVTVSRLSSTTEQIQTSADGCLTWTARSSGIDNFGGTCINFGNGLFVALGLDVGDGVTWIAVVSDDDGETWNSYSIPQPANVYRSIVYAPELGLWLALGDQGEIITAPATADSWTLVTTLTPVPDNEGWTCVEWGANKFVVVGNADSSSNVVRTSPDSLTWSPQTSLIRWWQSVRHHDGIFVAVNSGSPDVASRNMTAPDSAAVWTPRVSPASDQWMSVDKGAGIWLAVSNNSAQMQYSDDDAVTWATNSVTDSAGSWFVLFAGGQFVVCRDDLTSSGFTILTSADGLTGWVTRTTAMPDGTRQVAYSSCPTVSCGSPPSGTTGAPYTHTFPSSGQVSVYYSISSGSLPPGLELDPATGAVSGTPTTNGVYPFTVRIQDGQFALAHDDGSVSGLIVSTSPTGKTWTTQTTAITDSGKCIVYGPDAGLYVCGTNLAGTTEQIQTSPDGVNWTARSSPADNHSVLAVKWGGGQFMAIWHSGGTYHVMTSPDGITWTDQTIADSSIHWVDLAYSPTLDVWVTVANNSQFNSIMSSDDSGVTWAMRDNPGNNGGLCIAWGAGKFVLLGGTVGSGNHLATSADGHTWAVQSNPSSQNWLALTYSAGRFVAVTDNGTNRTMHSTDGIAWTLVGASAAKSWDCVAYGAGNYAAGANDSASTAAVMTSPTAATWASQTTPSIGFAEGMCWGAAGECSNTADCSITIGAGSTFGNIWSGGSGQNRGNHW